MSLESEPSAGQRSWWATAIIDMGPNRLLLRGYKIEDLVGRVSYVDMVYLMLVGELPTPIHRGLLEAVLVAACDHGIISPAVAAARMAATCGVTINSAIATGINLLGDIHGGASELVMEMLYEMDRRVEQCGQTHDRAAHEVLLGFKQQRDHVPGFGHPLHDDDPRVRRLFELARAAQSEGGVSGRFLDWIQQVQTAIVEIWGKRIPVNIDGAVGAIQCELGLSTKMAKPLFCLSRAIGISAHVLEELEGGRRLKSPIPPDMMSSLAPYVGTPPRQLPPDAHE